MKRQYARDTNCVKKGKLLAQLAAVSSGGGTRDSASGNTLNSESGDFHGKHIGDDQRPNLHSTPIHSNFTISAPNFGSSTPISSIGSPENNLFDIGAEWLDDDAAQLGENTCEEEEKSGEEESIHYNKLRMPLFGPTASPSQLSVDDFCCLLVAYQRKNHISDSAMNSFCKLIKRLLPSPNACPASFGIVQRKIKDFARKQIGQICSNITQLCGSCHATLDDRNRTEHNCGTAGLRKKPAAFFNCDIELQLKLIIAHNGTEILKFLDETSTFCSKSTAVRDISSGQFYRSNVLPNPKGNELTLNLLINADGAKFTKSKAGSFWPVDAQIVELPPKLRVKFENAVLFCLWQGETKPEWNVLMKSVISQLRKLSQIGFLAKIGPLDYYIRVRIIATVFDLPACASIWNTVQWNGKYGCMVCKDPGIVFSRRRIWPFSDAREPKDSNFWLTAYNEIAAGSLLPYFGVKGRSVLSELAIDPYLQNPLDFMHQAYEGVFDKILDCVFGSGKPWTFGRPAHKRELDSFISTIKFPVDFQRRIPSLDTLGYFKASEYKNLLLYGLLPALIKYVFDHQIQDPRIIDFLHWIAVYNEIAVRLNADSINLEEVAFVEELIRVWQELLPNFLGEENQTYNSHATCHLPHFVRSLGPLQNYSTFAFESFNYVYARMVTSAHGTLDQVARRFVQEKFIKSWSHAAAKNEALAGIIDSTFGKLLDGSSSGNKFGKVKLISKIETVHLGADEIIAVSSAFGDKAMSVLGVTAAKIGSTLIRTRSYEDGKNMCTHVAKFFEIESFFYAVIFKIFLYGERVYALCKELRITGNLLAKLPKCSNERLLDLWLEKDLPPYGTILSVVELSSEYRVVELKQFAKRCLLIDFCDYLVLMEECMTFEHN